MADYTPQEEARERAERIAEKLDAKQVGDRWRVECPNCNGRLEFRGTDSESGWPLYACFGSNWNCAKERPDDFLAAMVKAGADAADVFSGDGGSGVPAAEKEPEEKKPKDKYKPPPDWVIEEYHQELLIEQQKVLRWLKEKRGLTDDQIADHRIGWDREWKRITLPVYDAAGKCVNVRRYNPKAERKWLSDKGSSNSIFGDELLSPEPGSGFEHSNTVILTAGEFDALVTRRKLAEAGIITIEAPGRDSCVVVSLTGGESAKLAARPDLVERFEGKRVVVAYDADVAGRDGATGIGSALASVVQSVRLVDIAPDRSDGYDLTDAFMRDGRDGRWLWGLIEATPEWEPPDLDRFDLGEFMRNPPGVELVAAGWCYRGQLHVWFGDSGCGKTWVALWAMAEEIRAGKYVAYFDEENGPREIAERLVALGLTDEQVDARLLYYPNSGEFDSGKLDAMVKRYRPTLAVYDTAIAFLAGAELEENSSSDVKAWMDSGPKYLAELDGGPAVVVLDHVSLAATASETTNPRGSGAKLNTAQVGVFFYNDQRERFERGAETVLTVAKRKDRSGLLSLPSRLRLASSFPDGSSVSIEPDDGAGVPDGEELRAMVAKAFADAGKDEMAATPLSEAVFGKSQSRRDEYIARIRSMAGTILEEVPTGKKKPAVVYRLRETS